MIMQSTLGVTQGHWNDTIRYTALAFHCNVVSCTSVALPMALYIIYVYDYDYDYDFQSIQR